MNALVRHATAPKRRIPHRDGSGRISVDEFVAALARNGYIDIKKVRGEDGKQRSNNYWVLFDRKPSEWQFYAGDEPDDDRLGP